MITASPEFPILFLPFLAIYWSVGDYIKIQKALLLGFGYVFYAFLSPWFAFILGTYTLYIFLITSAFAGKSLFKYRAVLGSGAVFGGLALLAYFKYFNFILVQFSNVASKIGFVFTPSLASVILPLGISFYVFQSISYVVDVYKGRFKPVGLFDLSIYMCFLPTLLAGPICRSEELLGQLTSKFPRKLYDLDLILMLLISFLVKKVWLASWLSTTIVDPVFSSPAIFSGAELILATIGYALQIYFDFSGYTDLARALALLLGYNIPANFDLPYLSSSLSEFWSRWHISLSSWIRDYVYIPLGGNRCSFYKFGLNIMVAMLLSGLWHGADLKYLVWGGFHGIVLIVEKTISRISFFRPNIISTFALTCVGWIFFRAPTLDSAMTFIKSTLEWRVPLNQDIPHLQIIMLIFISFAVWLNAQKLLAGVKGVFEALSLTLKIIISSAIISVVLSLSPSGMPSFIYTNF